MCFESPFTRMISRLKYKCPPPPQLIKSLSKSWFCTIDPRMSWKLKRKFFTRGTAPGTASRDSTKQNWETITKFLMLNSCKAHTSWDQLKFLGLWQRLMLHIRNLGTHSNKNGEWNKICICIPENKKWHIEKEIFKKQSNTLTLSYKHS